MKLKFLYACALMSAIAFTGCDEKEKEKDPAPAPVTNNPQPATGMTAKVEGADWIAAVPVARLDSGDFTLMGVAFSGKAIGFYSLGNKISQPGTYTATGVYSEVIPGNTDGPTWGNPLAAITITKLDTVNNIVSGTFTLTGTAEPTSGATGTKTITNGIFTDITLQ